MDSDLLWEERAAHFDDWGQPLRPPPADIALYARFVGGHFAQHPTPVEARLLGVTPELACADWPVALRLTAVDQSEAMIRLVWPGDIPGRRHALVGDWLSPSALPTPSLVLTDGAPVFFARPQRLFEHVAALLADDGAFVVRLFCAPPRRQRLEEVMAALEARRFDTFHRFKWHVAMALQDDAETGVAQHRVWQVITEAGIDFTRQPQPGFSARAVATLRFYRDQAAGLHFPTRDAWAALLGASFEQVEAADAGTPGAERYTVFSAAFPRRPTR
jgi:hypothetical protein